MGISDYFLNDIKDCLSNMPFFVKVDSEKSKNKGIKNGVLQGSVLGSLFYHCQRYSLVFI